MSYSGDFSLPDFANAMEWNLVARETHVAIENGDGTYRRIPPKQWLIENSNVVMVGVDSRMAAPWWNTGGWAVQRLGFLPSSTTEFLPYVQTESRVCKLRSLTLCVFPRLMPVWYLEFRIPKYIKDVLIEVWRYDGEDVRVFDQLDRIESKLEAY